MTELIAAAAPGTPFYYYAIPTLEGVKHASPDIVDFDRCVAAAGGRGPIRADLLAAGFGDLFAPATAGRATSGSPAAGVPT